MHTPFAVAGDGHVRAAHHARAEVHEQRQRELGRGGARRVAHRTGRVAQRMGHAVRLRGRRVLGELHSLAKKNLSPIRASLSRGC